jgi:energy-coupling factor transport system permease protein
MKMRGFGLNVKSLKNPLKLIEFYMIPILISAVKTADELSATSLTRGLSNPEPRTHMLEVKLAGFDYALLAVTFIGFGMYALNFLGGAVIA